MAEPVAGSLRERMADGLLRSAATLGLECYEMRESARRSGERLSGFDPLTQVIVLHEWLSKVMIRAAISLTPSRLD